MNTSAAPPLSLTPSSVPSALSSSTTSTPSSVDRVPGHPARQPADAALREAFERALSRQAQAGAEEDDAGPQTPEVDTGFPGIGPGMNNPPPPWAPMANIAPALAAQPSTADSRHPPATAPVEASLGARLAALTVPASADGAQHWQFSFAQPGSPLSGVVLSAQPHAPWQVQVQMALPAQARERQVIDSRLAELRQRLAGRGAQIGDIELHDTSTPDDRFDPRPQR